MINYKLKLNMMFILLAFLMFNQIPSLADNSSQTICIDDNTLQITTVGNVCVDNDCFLVNRTEPQLCLNGCDFSINKCFNTEIETNIWFIIIILVLVAFFLWLYKKVYK